MFGMFPASMLPQLFRSEVVHRTVIYITRTNVKGGKDVARGRINKNGMGVAN